MDQIKIRLVGSIFFGVLWARHLCAYGTHSLALLWFFENLIFFGYFLAYLIRKFPVSKAGGFWERYFPFLPAGIPFLLVYNLPNWNTIKSLDLSRILTPAPVTNIEYAFVLQSIIMLGMACSGLGVLSLRSSFSIMTEARELITSGIYRYISHPMYLGQFLTYAGITAFHSNTSRWLLYMIFVCSQILRIRIEENKLTKTFKDYSSYRKSCWISL